MTSADNDSRMEEAAEAGARAADEERLLPSEDPDSPYLDDAVHWAAVYRELLDFKVAMLTMVREKRRDTGSDAVVTELGGTDLPFLERERERFEARLGFWERRVAELGAAETEGAAPG